MSLSSSLNLFGSIEKGLTLSCKSFGSPNWARTSDIMINSHALCHIARYITKKLTRLVFLCHKVLDRFFAEKLRE